MGSKQSEAGDSSGDAERSTTTEVTVSHASPGKVNVEEEVAPAVAEKEVHVGEKQSETETTWTEVSQGKARREVEKRNQDSLVSSPSRFACLDMDEKDEVEETENDQTGEGENHVEESKDIEEGEFQVEEIKQQRNVRKMPKNGETARVPIPRTSKSAHKFLKDNQQPTTLATTQSTGGRRKPSNH